MEDGANAIGGLGSELSMLEVPAENVDLISDSYEDLHFATGEAIGDSDIRALCNEIIDSMWSNERCTARDENTLSLPSFTTPIGDRLPLSLIVFLLGPS